MQTLPPSSLCFHSLRRSLKLPLLFRSPKTTNIYFPFLSQGERRRSLLQRSHALASGLSALVALITLIVLMRKKTSDTPQGKTVHGCWPNNDVSQTSHWNIKGVSVSEVMRIENMITQVQCY